MITLTIDGLIHIDGLPDFLKRPIKKSLSLPNPLHKQMARMGNIKALYACPEYFKYYEEDKKTGRLSIGRGLLKRTEDYLKKSGVAYRITDNTITNSLTKKYQPVKLRDYQKGVPEEIIKNNYGIIHLPTAYGKTIIGIEVARQLNQRTLIIAPRNQLLEQFRKAIQIHFRCKAKDITGNDTSIEDFNLVTWQTLCRLGDRGERISEEIGCAIIDESHGVVTKQRREALSKLKPKYLYGLSATPRRTDKQDEAIKFTFGETIIERTLDSENPVVEIVRYHNEFDHWEYAEIAKQLATDDRRNEIIKQHIEREVKERRKILVLTKRIKHYELLKEKFNSSKRDRVVELCSSNGKKKNAKLFESLASGEKEFDVLLGTYQYLSVGIDIPILVTVLLAGDLKSDVLVEQSIGRCKRILVGKQSPKIIDVHDTGNHILHNQFKARKKFYEKNGWNIKDV